MKKITILLDDSRVSGVSIYSLNLAKIFLKNNVRTKFILPKKNSDFLLDKIKKNNFEIEYCDIVNFSKNTKLDFIIFVLFKLSSYFRQLKKNDTDYYVIQGSLQFINIIVCYFLKKKVCLIVHDTHIAKFFKFFLFILNHAKNKIIFVSNRSELFYKNVFKKNITSTIPCGVNFDNFYFKIKNITNKQEFNIVTLCNINPEKNLDFMINVALYCQSNINKKIIFNIGGPIFESQKKYFEALKVKIKYFKLKNIRFHNFITNTKDFLENMDLYCCFSKFESSPLAVWEGMRASLPIVTTDVGDLDFHIKKGKFGFLINNENSKMYGEKINEILNNPEKYNLLSKNSFKYSKENFNYDKNYKYLLDFILS